MAVPSALRWYYWAGRTVVESCCAYEIVSLHSRGRLPPLTALSGRSKTLAWTLSGWVFFHLLVEHHVHRRIAAVRARTLIGGCDGAR